MPLALDNHDPVLQNTASLSFFIKVRNHFHCNGIGGHVLGWYITCINGKTLGIVELASCHSLLFCFSVPLRCAATSHCHRLHQSLLSPFAMFPIYIALIFLSSPFLCTYISDPKSPNTHYVQHPPGLDLTIKQQSLQQFKHLITRPSLPPQHQSWTGCREQRSTMMVSATEDGIQDNIGAGKNSARA
jgi:hypothetical protein